MSLDEKTPRPLYILYDFVNCEAQAVEYFIMKDKNLSVLEIEYQCWWWSGAARSDGNSNNGKHLVLPEYS